MFNSCNQIRVEGILRFVKIEDEYLRVDVNRGELKPVIYVFEEVMGDLPRLHELLIENIGKRVSFCSDRYGVIIHFPETNQTAELS